MIKIKTTLTIALITMMALGSVAWAADAKNYRAMGKLTKVNSTQVTIRTSAQDLEIAHDAKTKVSGGELRTGATATITYVKMAGVPYATEIAVRSADR